MVNIKFAKLRDSAKIPTKRKEDAGYDIYIDIEGVLAIKPHQTSLLPTGIASAFPEGYFFNILERGSTGTAGIGQRAGVIDSGYRGEWFVPITNHNEKTLYIVPKNYDVTNLKGNVYYKEKAIAQAVLLPVPETNIEEVKFNILENISSVRGVGSLGSTNK